jgi:hypothetical protein
MGRRGCHRILVMLMAAAMVALAAATYLTSSPDNHSLRPRSRDDEAAIARVEAIRHEDVQLFLDAITTVKSGRPMLCPANNLDLLPRRDALLEAIARLASVLAIDDGRRIGQYLTWQVADGDSPWGLSELAPVRERIEPYVERAKLQIIEEIHKQQAERIPPAAGLR